MAGMFYSLQEVVEKLQKTEEEIKQIVRQGRLREFRDGPNLLFKVDEVESLMVETNITAPKEPPAPPIQEPLAEEPSMPEASTPEPPAPEPVMEEPQMAESPVPEPVMEEPPAPAPEPPMPEPSEAEEQVEEEEISLAPEPTEEVPAESGLTSADTSLAGISEEIEVLSEAGSEYQPPDDTMSETRVTSDETTLAGTGEMPLTGSTLGESPLISSGSGEASLEEIEEDVNLDSFGSGSGLLDLSLQADDTSLGGILDEIYTSEGEKSAEGEQSDAAASAMEVAAETEEILVETQPGLGPVPMAKAYIEPEPDALSNACGYMLILPLLAVTYAAIIVVAGQRGFIPSILAPIQNLIWYIMGGLAVVALVIVGIPFIQSLGGAEAGAKAKPKKAPKAKKPKKAKKGKKPKKAKS